jgi:WD40 repeat protein
MDTCIRKQLIVTCSKDKTIRIWNYNTKNLEISQVVNEEALAVAMHPSGFHLVVAL